MPKLICPGHECGLWGVPLEKVVDFTNISEDQFECCLWHEVQEKCSRDPRFRSSPDAEDHFDPMPPEEIEDEE
jgi:hypothetical protein